MLLVCFERKKSNLCVAHLSPTGSSMSWSTTFSRTRCTILSPSVEGVHKRHREAAVGCGASADPRGEPLTLTSHTDSVNSVMVAAGDDATVRLLDANRSDQVRTYAKRRQKISIY
jgi:hypothetical protein